jgi:acetyl-CoA carboxylase biotin carboxyl carrier protein
LKKINPSNINYGNERPKMKQIDSARKDILNDDSENLDVPFQNQVTALYELMKSEKLEELELSEVGFYIYLKRKGKNQPHMISSHNLHNNLQYNLHNPAEPKNEKPANELTIKSPITGMFYRAPSPTSSAFVKEGDEVEPGKTLCIVEAMKVMNEIKSDSRAKIVKILVENGKPVTANQDLFVIEKA